jgi:predicted porin
MNRKLAICLAGITSLSLLYCAGAQAQSVKLYGVVDTGIEYINHANPAGDSLARMPITTGELPSRFGVTGVEDLGDGYKAVFTLENGLAVATGAANQGGRLFGRQAFVGLDGPLGALTFGRQYSMMTWAMQPADFVGPSIYGLTSIDPWIANARIDNTVSYRKKFGGFSTGGTYSFGRDASGGTASNSPGQGNCAGEIPGNAQACREWSVALQYDAANWGVSTAYDHQNGGPGAAANLFNGIAPLSLANGGNTDSHLMFDAYTKYDKFLVSAIWLHRLVGSAAPATPNVTSDQYALEVGYAMTPALRFDGMVQRVINQQEDTRATMEVARATYYLSARTAVYAQFGFLQNSDNAAYSVSNGGSVTPAKGMSQIASMIGIRESF